MAKRISIKSSAPTNLRVRKWRKLFLSDNLKSFFLISPVQYEITDEDRIKKIRENASEHYFYPPEMLIIRLLPGKIHIQAGYRSYARLVETGIDEPLYVWRDDELIYVIDKKKVICLNFSDSNTIKFIFE